MERNIKQDYDSLIETCKTNLQIELRQFKKEKLKIKQNTYKKITTEHLVKYIIDKGNLFIFLIHLTFLFVFRLFILGSI